MIFDVTDRMEIYAESIPGLSDLIGELECRDIDAMEDGTYFTALGTKYFLQTFMSSDIPKAYEVHERYIDLMMVLEGREMLLTSAALEKMPEGHDGETDFGTLSAEDETASQLTRGRFALIFPYEPHCPGLSPVGIPERVRKLVAKIPFSRKP